MGPKSTWIQRLAAWGVHLFTATGIVCAFFALIEVRDHRFAHAFVWLLVALFVDGIDGTFARILRVREVLPHVSGKWIDYVVDFTNYAFVPAYFLYEAGYETATGYVYLLPEGWREASIALVLLVSALYYGLDGMVDEGYHFVGFPVLWNVVAFYLYFVIQAGPWVNLVLVAVFAIAHFVPLKYPYPSRTKRFMTLNIVFTVGGFVANGWIVWHHLAGESTPRWLVWTSLASAGYYLWMTFLYTFSAQSTKPTV